MDENILLEIRDVSHTYRLTNGELKVADSVSLKIKRGETFGLVGESGSGKSTLGKIAVGMLTPSSGSVIFRKVKGGKVCEYNVTKEKRSVGQMIFQDPFSSLNPRMKACDIIAEGLDLRNSQNPFALSDHFHQTNRREKVLNLLRTVGLGADHMDMYPHQFSGGQRQRIGIARALAVEPEFLVCDEPLSSFDAYIQSQIILLLKDLQSKLNLTYLFISHDLSIVRNISDRVGVMHGGKIVELGTAEEIVENPKHPQTKKLVESAFSFERFITKFKSKD